MAAIPNDDRNPPWVLVQLIQLIGMQNGDVTVTLHEGKFGNGAIKHRLKDSSSKETQDTDQGGKRRKQQAGREQPSTIRIGGVETFIKERLIEWLVAEGGKFAILHVQVRENQITDYLISNRRRMI